MPPLLLRQHRPRGPRQGDPRRRAAGSAHLRLVRGGADLARVRALVDHDRRRLSAAAGRPLRRQPRRRAPRRGHDARVDDDEVERRRDALGRSGGGSDPDRDVGARGRDDRDRAHRTRARGDERPHPRHGRNERGRRHPRRRRSAAHDRVRDRVGPPGGGTADRHQVDRRRRRLDRVGGRGRLSPRRATERRSRSGADLLRPGRHPGDGDGREPAARPPQPGVLPRGSHATRHRGRERGDGGARRADRPRSARARGVDRRDREREHGERDQDGLARAGPRPAPLRAARLRRRRPAARCGRRAGARHPEGDRAAAPRRLLGARAAPRRHPRRQDLDAGVPVQHRRRVGREPPVRPDHRARARRASARGLCRRAGDSTRDQHALLRAELRARGRDRAGRAGRGRPRAGVPPVRRAPRRALRLRDRPAR